MERQDLGMEPGQRIERALTQRGWSQTDLAERMGVPQPTISKIVRGEMPGKVHWPRIAELLDVDEDWIRTGLPPQSWEVQLGDNEIREVVGPMVQQLVSQLDRVEQELAKAQALAATIKTLLYGDAPEQSPSSRSESASLRAAAERRTAYDAEAARRRLEGIDDEKQA